MILSVCVELYLELAHADARIDLLAGRLVPSHTLHFGFAGLKKLF